MTDRIGFVFKPYEAPEQEPFERLFEIFKELITHTSGDVDEALDWMEELDKEYHLFTAEYSMDDFIEDLKKRGYLREEIDFQDGQGGDGEEGDEGNGRGRLSITAKTERLLRQHALEQIFGKLKKSASGNHRTKYRGQGDEHCAYD